MILSDAFCVRKNANKFLSCMSSYIFDCDFRIALNRISKRKSSHKIGTKSQKD